MDPRLPGVFLLMEELGGFKLKELEDRIILQKTIYLLQLFGIDLKFRFSWYLRGPYSKELTRSAFEIEENAQIKEKVSKFKLGQSVKPPINAVKELISKKPANIEKSDWLELLSSIHFLKHISKSPVSRDNIAGHTRIKQKTSKEDDVLCAWDTLQGAELIDKMVVNRVQSE